LLNHHANKTHLRRARLAGIETLVLDNLTSGSLSNADTISMRPLFTSLATLASTLLSATLAAAPLVAHGTVASSDTNSHRIVVQHKDRLGIHGDIETVQLSSDATPEDMQRKLRELRSRTDIAFAVEDQRRYAHAVPNDALFSSQWYLQDVQPAAVAANLAWDITTGGTGTVVAVLDTGVRFDHPDLQRAWQTGKLLPGYDFVSGEDTTSFLTANDGDGRDADPSDPGDWIDSADQQKSLFHDCPIQTSSWHGTRVSGLIGAASNNGIGIAGVSWGTWILPVRVLGKCGGYDSDIFPAMRWAAGLHVDGVPDNPYPAKILNLSFGGDGACTPGYQSVIQELSAIGVLVVVSAGNASGPVEAPANCPLAMAVAGIRHVGTKVGYSSFGPEIAIAAPAGNCFNLSGPCLYSLTTTYDIGSAGPAGSDYTNQLKTNLGTSFSAPLVAGVAALMHSVNGKLSATQLNSRLQESARPFPRSPTLNDCPVPANDPNPECNCTTSTCGAGMLYAPGAVAAAQRPIANIVAPSNFAAGSAITLDASNSAAACNRSIASFSWTVINTIGTSPPVLSGSSQASVQLNAPVSGSYTLRVLVTDNEGSTDSGDIVIHSSYIDNSTTAIAVAPACPTAINVVEPSTPQIVATAPPAPDSGGGGGGGTMTWYWIAALLGTGLQRKKH
jgi:serine protease